MDERKAPGGGTRLPTSLLAWLTLGGAFACGPSLTSVHEGTVRFEHCNRLDLDESVAKQECKQCWSSWLGEYTYGQPRDRIDYARRRSRALANGDGPTVAGGGPAEPRRAAVLSRRAGADERSNTAPTRRDGLEERRRRRRIARKDATRNRRPKAAPTSAERRGRPAASVCGNGHAEGLKPPTGSGVRASNGSTNGGTPTTNGGAPASNGCSSKCGSDYSSCMKRCFD